MAFIITNFIGFETGNDQEADVVSGTLSYGTTTPPSGGFFLELDDDGEDYRLLVDPAGLKSAPKYLAVGFKIKLADATPASDADIIVLSVLGGDSKTSSIGIDTDGKLYVTDTSGTNLRTGTTVLSNDTWYSIEFRTFQDATTGYFHVYLDGNATPEVTIDTFFDSGSTAPDFIRLQNPHVSTSVVSYDDIYIKADTADGSVADLIGAGDGVDWQSPGYYQSAGTGISSQGNAPAAGSLAGTGDNPLNDSNQAEWTGATDDADWAADGSVRAGPNTDITGTVIAGKYWYRADSDGGGSTTHYLHTGNFDGTTWSITETEVSIPAGNAEYWLMDSANMPTATDEDFAFGIRVSGAKDLHIYEAGGWILQTVSSGTTFEQSAAGALTFAGVVAAIKIQFQALAGAVTFTGIPTQKTITTKSGAVTFVGTPTKKTIPANFTGALTFAGAVAGIKLVMKAVSGALTFVGVTVAQGLKSLSGAVTFSGAIAKLTKTAKSGALTFTGLVAGVKTALQSVAGALTFTGTLKGKGLKALFGSLTFTGTAKKKTIITKSGAVTFTGTLTNQAKKIFTGAVTFTGTLKGKALKVLAGAVTFTGSVTNKTLKALAGAVTFIGGFASLFIDGSGGTEFTQSAAGALTSSGALSLKTSRTIAGILTFEGSITKKIGKIISAALSFVGQLAALGITVFEALTLRSRAVNLTLYTRDITLTLPADVVALSLFDRDITLNTPSRVIDFSLPT